MRNARAFPLAPAALASVSFGYKFEFEFAFLFRRCGGFGLFAFIFSSNLGRRINGLSISF